MGLHPSCNYRGFSSTDEAFFEKRLKKWCDQICMHGKSMLIFDKPTLLVGGKAILESDEEQIFYKVVLSNFTLTYICINGSMCIMYKIWENKTQSVMYKMPQNWEGTELWVGSD